MTMRAKDLNRMTEARDLLAGKLISTWLVSGGKVGHQSLDAQRFKASTSGSEFRHLVITYAKPPHAGIDFDVHCDRGRTRARCLLQSSSHVKTMDDRRDFVLQTGVFLPEPETAETEDRSRDTGAPQFQPFFHGRHAEPIGTFTLQPARASDRAVTVSVRFDCGEDSDLRGDARAHYAKVPRERIEIYLDPCRACG